MTRDRQGAARAALSRIVEASGLSIVEFARTVLAGRDERTLRRKLGGEALPAGLAEWLGRVLTVDVTDDEVTVRIARVARE